MDGGRCFGQWLVLLSCGYLQNPSDYSNAIYGPSLDRVVTFLVPFPEIIVVAPVVKKLLELVIENDLDDTS